MVLAPVETEAVLMMRFTSDAPPDLITFVKERLVSGGIIIITEETSSDGTTILGLTTTQDELEAEAEQIKLVKETGNTSIMEYFTVENRDKFRGVVEGKHTEHDSEGLFNCADRAELVRCMLDEINVLERGSITSNLSRKLDELKVPYVHKKHSKKDDEVIKSRALSTRKFSSKTQPYRPDASSLCLRHVLESANLVDLVTPVHVPRIRDKLLKETLHIRNITPPIESISDYYGEEVAYYFAWMDHFTRWLIIPAILGIVVFSLRVYRGDSIETDEYTPFYGLVTFLWAIIALRYWDRAENRLAYTWGTFSVTGYEHKHFNLRPEFEGELRVSPVTGRLEKYYPAWKRRCKYFVSGFITILLLSVAFSVMIMSLNLQGYIRPKNDPERWNEENEHPFYYPFLSTLAEEGNLFDAASNYMAYVPVFLHVICILLMNAAYRHIAENLTEWENHETENDYRNSLILKRFLFEAFDCYIALFYLAFYERDMERVRGELVSIFNIDAFRRLLLEYVVPFVMQRASGNAEEKDKKDLDAEHKKTDSMTKRSHRPLSTEAKRDEYEQFDDYLEMVIELGYVTLFASAYPLASAISIIANLIEVRTDFFKLTKVCLRPRCIRADGIGMWKGLITAIVWLSALTNCLIFGITSQQLMHYMPEFFFMDEMGHMRLTPGKGWIIVFIIFGMERILIYSALIIDMLIPEVPEDVVIEIERRQHVRAEEAHMMRMLELKREGSDGGGKGGGDGAAGVVKK